jgi:hypothetical protein
MDDTYKYAQISGGNGNAGIGGAAGAGGVGVATTQHIVAKRRKYLPTLADLVDRLSITLQKMIFIPERREEYEAETTALMHDIDIVISEHKATPIGAKEVRAILVIMLANRYIWENEAAARAAADGNLPLETKYHRLKSTHSINGVRNSAKNVLSAVDQGRHDYKIDCFAAELVEELGNWNVFGQNGGAQ